MDNAHTFVGDQSISDFFADILETMSVEDTDRVETSMKLPDGKVIIFEICVTDVVRVQ